MSDPGRDAGSEVPVFVVGSDHPRLLRDGVLAFPAMLAAIAAARREVYLEMYWIGADLIGERFRDALAERARAGVEVRVIYDALGSLGVSTGFWDPLLTAGGQVREFHALSPFDPTFRLDRLEKRDHRKLLVVDGEIGFTGGINLGLPWAPESEGGGGWRDDMIEARGPCAAEMRSLFVATWAAERAEPVPPEAVALRRTEPSRPVWMLAGQKRKNRNIHHEYIRRIRLATRTVDIANSYFVPDRAVRACLFRAVARGVRVRVLLPARGDVPIVQFAQEAMFDTLLRHGVQIYAYEGPMMHAKSAAVDGRFCTIGSYNLDERSWRKNLELNIAVEDEAFTAHVTQWFERDLERSVRLKLGRWRNRSVARRGIEWVAFAFRELF